MADLGIVTRMVDEGVDRAAAVAVVDQVYRLMLEQLAAGKTVRIDGIGQLSAPSTPTFVEGSCKMRCRMQRKVRLRSPVIIQKGEPYDRL